jgi:AraC-like DNA-binding protein
VHNAARSGTIKNERPAFPFLTGIDPPPEPGSFRLLLVESGVARLEGGPQPVTLLPRTLLLLPPGSARWLLKGAGAVIRGCSFGRSLVDPLMLGEAVVAELDLAGTRNADEGFRTTRLPPEEFREASSLLSLLDREAREGKPGSEAMVRLKLMESILLLYRAGCPAAGSVNPAPFSIDAVQRFLQERYADPLTLPVIAARFGFNPSYFSRLFHQQAGVPLVEYINGVRIRRSCALLKRTSLGVLEIAFSVGYNNLSHFNRYFRKLMGMSPREYRAQGGK